MRCDRCNERDAVINLTQVEQDAKITLHLCEQCAAEHGIETGATLLKSPLGDFLASMGKGTSAVGAPTDGIRCPSCGSTLQDFRDAGRLGCGECYGAFEGHLRDLLRRVHGSSQHTGEAYFRGGEVPSDQQRLLADLKDQLKRAVDAENFELAAELRDRIRVLE